MIKIQLYTGDKTYMFPNGELAPVERVLQDFPAALTFPHIIETDALSQVLFSMENLSAVMTTYEINPEWPIEEVITAIETIRNTKSPIDNAPSPEERIAAAMEYQNLMNS